MTTTQAQTIRHGDATYSDPFVTDGTDGVYPAGTVLCTVTYDDSDRFVTRAPAGLL